MSAFRHGVTERYSTVLDFIEQEIGAARPAPNTVEISQTTGLSLGEVSRALSALEHLGYITRMPRRLRNIRLCSPAVKMAPDEHLIAEMNSRGYFVRKVGQL